MNNTLTKAGKDKDKTTEAKPDTYKNQNISQTREKGQGKTAGERERIGGKDTISGHENTTAVGRGNEYTETVPEKTESEGRHDAEPEERNSGSEKATGGSEDRVGSKEPDNSLNAVESQEPELGKTSENTEGSRDTRFGSDKMDTTEIFVKDKGQWEKQRKELQANGKRDPDKVGPNDTKLRAAGGEVENTVEAVKAEVTENSTVTFETKERQTSNNSIGSPDKRRVIPSRVNVTQYTMYRAGGEESGATATNSPKKEDKKEKDPTEDRREELEKEDKANEREKEANQSFRGERFGRGGEILNDSSSSSSVCSSPAERSCSPLPRLYHGYHRVVAGVEPEAVEFFCNHSYALSGDARRSCQSDGSWSGRQPVCVRGASSLVANAQHQISQFNHTNSNFRVNTFPEKKNAFLITLSHH